MDISGDEIALEVLQQFEKLPPKAKPLTRSNGLREWVPLSGIVAKGRNNLTCLALATGMKCLSQDKVSQAGGIVLHDWHAEVLAIRSLNRFLLEECHALISKNRLSEYIRLRKPEERTMAQSQPFALYDDIALHMYCSEAPCGDASMELTMAAQEDPTPWAIPTFTRVDADESEASLPFLSDGVAQMPESSTDAFPLHGRGYFSALGAVRRKPSRPDAPPTLSKSCSDKLALKQCTSLLSSITSLLISPSNLYLSSLVLPESQYSQTACTRAFSRNGRMKEVAGKVWDGGYHWKEFSIKTTNRAFVYSRRQPMTTAEKLVASNISTSWIKDPTATGSSETLIGGVLQGRKQFDIRGASKVCKKRILRLAIDTAMLAAAPIVGSCVQPSTYSEMKNSSHLEARRKVKGEVRRSALKGWVRNSEGDDFDVESGRLLEGP